MKILVLNSLFHYNRVTFGLRKSHNSSITNFFSFTKLEPETLFKGEQVLNYLNQLVLSPQLCDINNLLAYGLNEVEFNPPPLLKTL